MWCHVQPAEPPETPHAEPRGGPPEQVRGVWRRLHRAGQAEATHACARKRAVGQPGQHLRVRGVWRSIHHVTPPQKSHEGSQAGQCREVSKNGRLVSVKNWTKMADWSVSRTGQKWQTGQCQEVLIMHSFMCYFSKLEHIAHYKAKNQDS